MKYSLMTLIVMRALALGAALVFLPVAASAQVTLPRDTLPARAQNAGTRNVLNLELWAGLGTHSMEWGALGGLPRLNFAITAIRLERSVAHARGMTIDYTLDAVPFARLSPFHVEIHDRGCPRDGRFCPLALFSPGSSYAFGLNPLGIQAVFRQKRALQFRIGGSGGFLWFDRAVPTSSGTQFNLTAMVETAAQYVSESGLGVSISCRLHHLSNAGLGASNPGVASPLLAVGLRKRLAH